MAHIRAIRQVQFHPPGVTPNDATALSDWRAKDPAQYVAALRKTMVAHHIFDEWNAEYGPSDERTVAWMVTIERCDCCPAEIAHL